MSITEEVPYRHDPLATRTALAAQTGALRAAVHALTAEDLARPTRLGDWTVRELVAHLGIVLDWVPRHLDEPVPDGEPLTLTGWVAVTRTAAAAIAAGVREYAADAFAGPPAAVAAEFDTAADALLAVLHGPSAADPNRSIAMRFGPMLLTDFLVTRLVETVVHADDLAHALGRTDFPHDRQAVGTVAGLLTAVAAGRSPAGGAPDTSRLDALTWIGLATGRTAWTDDHDVPAGLGALLPLMG
ncbi:maleylpyruvate isomerase family mycothiol-dependent enzyme [Kitasatospora sp. NBC_01539]|uniref:maleylpyruvate isomerase family mycothiol-dependent enzyme n=1 Tax=Kitasatospora sp. NBC_01539 TaxID=2903577 RepID=UPI0038600B35